MAIFTVTSCSTTANVVGSGKVFRISGDGLTYVNGLFSFTRTSAEAETAVTTDDGDGVNAATGAFSGVRTIRFKASNDPSSMNEHLKATDPVRGDVPETPEAVAPAFQSRMSTDADDGGVDGMFVCNGKQCSYSDISKETSVKYLKNAVDTLLKYDGSRKFEFTGETYGDTLVHFRKMLDVYDRYGVSDSAVSIMRVSVADGVITDLMYAVGDGDGGFSEIVCPNCAAWEPVFHPDSSEWDLNN